MSSRLLGPDTSQHCACPVMLLRLPAKHTHSAGQDPWKVRRLSHRPERKARVRGGQHRRRNHRNLAKKPHCQGNVVPADLRFRQNPAKPVHPPVADHFHIAQSPCCYPTQLPTANRFSWLRWASGQKLTSRRPSVAVAVSKIKISELPSEMRTKQLSFPSPLRHMAFLSDKPFKFVVLDATNAQPGA